MGMSLVNKMLYFVAAHIRDLFFLTGLILGKDNRYPTLTILYYANRHEGNNYTFYVEGNEKNCTF